MERPQPSGETRHSQVPFDRVLFALGIKLVVKW